MSDKKFTIGIETTADTSGAKKATGALDETTDKAKELDTSLNQVGRPASTGGLGLPAIPAQAKKASEGIKEVKNESTHLGNSGDGGRAVLEFSRAFEDAQYGIRGVLNNLPGLIAALGGGAGLAGVISVLAVAGSVVWEQMGKSAKDATDPAIDYLDILQKIAKEFGNPDLDLEKARGKGADTALEKQKQFAEGQQRIANSELDFEKKRIKGDSAVAIAKERLNLARQEAQINTASGETAVKLAKDREATLKRIVELERLALESVRLAEERAAAAKVTAASQGLDEADRAKTNLQGPAAESARDLQAAREGLAKNQEERIRSVRLLEGLKAEELKKQAFSNNPLQILESSERVIELSKKIDTLLNTPSQFEIRSGQQVGEAKDVSTQAAENLLKASEAQREAAEKLRNATQDRDNLLRGNNLDRQTETGLSKISATAAAEAGVEKDKTSLVGQLDGLVAGIGESGGKDLAPFITEMKAILQDKALSADELARLPVLLQQYLGKVANLGAAQNTAIRDASSRMDELEREIRNLKSTAGTRNP